MEEWSAVANARSSAVAHFSIPPNAPHTVTCNLSTKCFTFLKMLHHHHVHRINMSTPSAHLACVCIHTRRPIITCSVLNSNGGPIQINDSPSKQSQPNNSSSSEAFSTPLTLVNGWPATSSIDDSLVRTKFIAETLLPTRHGIFRLRGYKHSVSGRNIIFH